MQKGQTEDLRSNTTWLKQLEVGSHIDASVNKLAANIAVLVFWLAD